MKVKLLKKVRERFKILYYFNTRTVQLTDTEYYFPVRASREIIGDISYSSIDEATNWLKRMIIAILKDEHKSLGRKRQAKHAHENKFKQIWP